MTDQELNIAIAEACGWTDIPIIGGMYGQTPIPDYCNDLNAMNYPHAKVNADKFAINLAKVVLGFSGYNETITLNYWALERIANATARQRAEAFARTLNVWKE